MRIANIKVHHFDFSYGKMGSYYHIDITIDELGKYNSSITHTLRLAVGMSISEAIDSILSLASDLAKSL